MLSCKINSIYGDQRNSLRINIILILKMTLALVRAAMVSWRSATLSCNNIVLCFLSLVCLYIMYSTGLQITELASLYMYRWTQLLSTVTVQVYRTCFTVHVQVYTICKSVQYRCTQLVNLYSIGLQNWCVSPHCQAWSRWEHSQ